MAGNALERRSFCGLQGVLPGIKFIKESVPVDPLIINWSHYSEAILLVPVKTFHQCDFPGIAFQVIGRFR